MTIQYLTFFCLMMALVSMWFYRSAWGWAPLLLVSYVLALETGIAQPISVIPIGALFICCLILKQHYPIIYRLFIGTAVVLISLGLNFHLIPGFSNLKMQGGFWMNYDKPFIGFFALALLIPLIQTKSEWKHLIIKATPLIFGAMICLAIIALTTNTVQWDVKIPSNFLLRILTNLCLVVIPEEAFFRGFVQGQITKALKSGIQAPIISITLSSLLFVFCHLEWHSSMAMLVCVLIAGIFYGGIYYYTHKIEATILCHFSVNLVHMICFSYHIN